MSQKTKKVDFQTYLYLNHNQFIIYVAEILSNEKQIGYTYVLKNNEQVDLLSYHDWDKTGVDEMYNIKKKYEII